MRSHLLLSLATLLLLGARGATAQDAEIRDSVMDSRSHAVRRLHIRLPEHYDLPSAAHDRYPVIVALDADGIEFGTISNVARRLSFPAALAVPASIIVGIETARTRAFDMYTPPKTHSDTLNHAGGGADAYLGFLQDDLLPWIRAHYRTEPFFVLVGHSASGFFSVYAAAQRPALFQGIVATSPALWWNGDAFARELGRKIAAMPKPSRMFLARGGFDIRMLSSGVDAFAAVRASSRTDSSFLFKLYPKDNHQSTGVIGNVEGLQFIFEPVTLTTSEAARVDDFNATSRQYIDAFNATRTRYASGARSFGLTPTLPPEWFAWFRSLVALRGHPDALAPICDRYAGDRPDLPIGYRCAADGLVQSGDTAGAIDRLNRARQAALTLRDSSEVSRISSQIRRLGGQTGTD
jgi:predicted alpha/beta superfamily hydrolase